MDLNALGILDQYDCREYDFDDDDRLYIRRSYQFRFIRAYLYIEIASIFRTLCHSHKHSGNEKTQKKPMYSHFNSKTTDIEHIKYSEIALYR